MKTAKLLLTKKREQFRFQIRQKELDKIFKSRRSQFKMELEQVMEVPEDNQSEITENEESKQCYHNQQEEEKQDLKQYIIYSPVKEPPLIKPVTIFRQEERKPVLQKPKMLKIEEAFPRKKQEFQPRKQVIGNKYAYFPSDFLGEGANGRVYKGFEISDPSKIIAVKKISMKHLSKDRVLREISIQQKLDNPYIVKLFNHYFDYDMCYLVLEFCEGGSLAEKVSRNEIKFHQGIEYFKQILHAMKYFWERQIIHRDLKLENILIKNEQVKLADFGFARQISNLSCYSYKCGTPATMAPELLLANDHCRIEYNGKQDVWALGVILHELAYGIHPFATDMNRLINNQRVFISNMKPLVESFLIRSLESNQTVRMTLDECFEHPIFKDNHKKRVSPAKAVFCEPLIQQPPQPQNNISGMAVVLFACGLVWLFCYYFYFLLKKLA